MPILLVFGTSTTYGAWDIEGGWVQRLRKQFDTEQLEKKREYTLIYNLGIDGDTTTGVLERFESETKRRLWPDEEIILVFAVGTNDAIFDIDKGKFRTSEEDFKENISEIIKRARKISDKIIFLGGKPVDDSKTQPVEWDKNISYREEDGKRYDSLMEEVCLKEKVFFIDMYDKLEKMGFKKYLDDGVHPNSEGHKIIFEIVRDFLINEKII
jgi:lysophospholipase L1-like esterase